MAAVHGPLLALAVVFLLLHVLVFLPVRRVCQRRRWARASEWCMGTWHRDVKLQKLMRRKRLRAWSEFLAWFQHLGLCAALVLLVFNGSESLGASLHRLATRLVPSYCVIQAFCCFYSGVSEDAGFSRLVRRWSVQRDACLRLLEWARTPVVPYFVSVAVVEAYANFTGLFPAAVTVQGRFAFRVVASITNQRVDQAVILNGAIAAYHIWTAPSYSSAEALIEFIHFLMTVVVSGMSEALLARQALSELEAKDSRSVESSIEHMLCGVCDAVVHLKRDLTLKRKSPQLDALLLRGSGAGDAGEGEAFLDLLHDGGDKDKFWSFIQAQSEEAPGSSLPQTLHLVMRDTNLTPVPVQLFHTQYLDAADELFHIIGIRESGDAEARALPSRFSPRGSLDSASASWSIRAHSQESISELSSQKSDNLQALAQVPLEGDAPDEIAVWVKVFQKGLPMSQCTPGFFSAFGGPSLKQGTKLVNWIPRHQRQQVETEVQQRCNRLMHEEAHRDDGFKVCFRPHSKARHLLVHVHMALSLAPPESRSCERLQSLQDLDEVLAKVTCVGFRQAYGRVPDLERAHADGAGLGTSQGRPRGIAL